MRLVALEAFRFFPVDIVARRAAKRRMFALVLAELLDLFGVAGQTGIRQVRRKGDLERCMRVCMTGEAALGFEMRLALMAHVALRNIVL